VVAVPLASPLWRALVAIVAEPGEYAPRRVEAVFREADLTVAISVAGPPSVEKLPPRWADRLREAGLIAPAAVRLAAHMTEVRAARYRPDTLPGRVLDALFAFGPLSVGRLAGIAELGLDVERSPSGALNRALDDLAQEGAITPPAALWPTEAGRALIEGATTWTA